MNKLFFSEELPRPEQMHNMIYSMCKSMNANKLLKYVKKIDTLDEKYQKGKHLGII